MLCIEGSEIYFNDRLIDLLKRNENDEVQRILEQFQRLCGLVNSSLTISDLRDSSRLATLLHYAAECGNNCIVKYLIDLKCKIDIQDVHGKTPLMLGICMERDDVVRILLRAKADIHLVDYEGKSALQLILERKITQSDMIDILLREVSLDEILKGITRRNLRKKLSKAIVKWEHAVYLDNAELLRVLLDRKKVHISITEGSLLHLAIKWQKFQSVKVLLEYGADVDALDCHNAMPIRYLYCHRLNPCSETLETMKMLVSRMTTLTSSADDDRMQICDILSDGDADTIEIIMQSNVDLNAPDRTGNTVMHYLAVNESEGVFAKIRGRHFDANVRNNNGYIPLHYAVNVRSFDAVKFYLENGANVNDTRNKYAISPLYSAFDPVKKFDKRIVELLLRYGADPQTQLSTSTIFDLVLDSGSDIHFADCLTRPKLVLIQLAIIEALGTKITKHVARSIERQKLWVIYFHKCRRLAGQLKKTVICDEVTLFDFLTANEEKILAYVSNVEFVKKLKKIIGELEVLSPYIYLLRNRLNEAIQSAKLREEQ